jgi:tetraacyldisaccharide-1-P 4'-kinase
VRAFPDHYLYTRADLESLDRELTWVTTGKDAVKIPPEWVGDRRLLELEEDVRTVGTGQSLVEWLLARLDAPARRT